MNGKRNTPLVRVGLRVLGLGLGSVSGAKRSAGTHRAYLPLDAGHSVRVIVV